MENTRTLTKIGADFCISFSTRPVTVQILCNDADEMGVVPRPSLSWVKDGVVAITQDEFGQTEFSEEFLSQGRNELLRLFTLNPTALISIPGSFGELFMNFVGLNISNPALVPPGINASNVDRELFSVLLGRWECRVNNMFGEDSAVTELMDCGKVHLFSANYF